MTISFSDFATACNRAGLRATDHGLRRWEITGGKPVVVVARRSDVLIWSGVTREGTVQDAIKSAKGKQ